MSMLGSCKNGPLEKRPCLFCSRNCRFQGFIWFDNFEVVVRWISLIHSYFNLPTHRVLQNFPLKTPTLWPLAHPISDLSHPCHWWCFLDLHRFGRPWHHGAGHHGPRRRGCRLGPTPRGGHGRGGSVTALGAQGHVGSLGFSPPTGLVSIVGGLEVPMHQKLREKYIIKTKNGNLTLF